jgi:hypothetical protein
VLPKDHKVKGSSNVICLPYEQYCVESIEDETFKLLGELVIHNQGSGYTCFVNSFMLFLSPDREVKIDAKNATLKFFEGINTVEKFEALGLPIKNVTKCSDGTANVAYEIDVSQSRKLNAALKSKKLDCIPILWVFSSPSFTEWRVKFEQRLVCKYLVLKLIDSIKGSQHDNNIDMYNLTLNGYSLKLPQSSSDTSSNIST